MAESMWWRMGMVDVAFRPGPSGSYWIDATGAVRYTIKPRILRCSNGHETSGEYVQTIGGHSYCTRCLAAMLDQFGARVREVT